MRGTAALDAGTIDAATAAVMGVWLALRVPVVARSAISLRD